jgi:hypothetical protein
MLQNRFLILLHQTSHFAASWYCRAGHVSDQPYIIQPFSSISCFESCMSSLPRIPSYFLSYPYWLVQYTKGASVRCLKVVQLLMTIASLLMLVGVLQLP